MPVCLINNGVEADCDDLRATGGLRADLYVANLSDILSYTVDVDGYITAITFEQYAGLYKFSSKNNSHTAGYTAAVGAAGANTYFNHNVVAKFFATTPTDDQVVEDMTVADVVFIVETKNKRFKAYGIDSGCQMTEAEQNSGQEGASDITDTLTFLGEERKLPQRVLDTDYATTKALLESYVVTP